MSYSISVVIPNYNGKDLLKTNLPYVYNALKTSNIADYEVIISDDASMDDSLQFISENYPDIILITNKENKGFAGNTNKGIFAATKDLILILNSDVQLTQGYFTSLLQHFDKTDTFGVMGRIIGLDSDNIQDGAKFPGYSFGNIISTKNYISKTKTSLYSLFLSGANALIGRKKLFYMGGFDELFNPYYSEDVDLGLRAWRLGYKVYYDDAAICRHPNSATIKKEPSNKVKIISKRNKMFLHYLHLDGFELVFFLLKTILKVVLRFLIGDINYGKSFVLFVKSISKLNQSKRNFKDFQKLANVKSTLSEIIDFIRKNIDTNEITTF